MGNCFSENKPATEAKYAVPGGTLGDDEERVTAVRPSRRTGANGAAASPGSGSASGNIKRLPANSATQKLDPKDFRFIGLRSEVKVKAPGSINGQAFQIDDCQDCDLYLLDHCAQVNIDQCKNCRIFIGPTAGSIFLRDSSNVKCAFITRQLRLRDVTDSDISLLCRTQPILEASSNIGLTCFTFNYPQLPGQLKGAKLDVLHNFWWHVHDFTPKAQLNWKYLPADLTTEKVLGGQLPTQVVEALGGGSNLGAEGPLVVTHGERPPPSPEHTYVFCIFPPSRTDAATQFINQAKHEAVVMTTNSAHVADDLMDHMKAKAGWPRAAERELVVPGPCIGMELYCLGQHTKTLCGAAHVLGGTYTDSQEVGAMFRKLGLEGTG